MNEKWVIAATAAFGLESTVRRECEKLGFEVLAVADGRIKFSGGPEEVADANLKLAVADRVMIETATFPAETFEELFDQTASIPWPKWIAPDGRIPVRARSIRSKLFSVPDIQAIVKKAIVRSMSGGGEDRMLPETGAVYAVEAVIRKDVVTISLDTTGEGLFKRGYRRQKGGAPLKETLAAGLVDLSYWKPERPLVDPFCGSGTILIEAALKARHIARGADRRFASDEWPIIGEEVYRARRREALKEARWDLPLNITGFDVDPKMIAIAKQNAEDAGVADDIHFYCKDMRSVDLQENFGVMITNPPYGQRLGEEKEVESLMRSFTERFLGMRTWSFYILTGLRGFEKIAGKEAERRRKLFNGGIETTYYQYPGPNPERFL